MTDAYLMLLFFFFLSSAIVAGDEAAKREWETFTLRAFANRWLTQTMIAAAVLLISLHRLGVGESVVNVKAALMIIPALMVLGYQGRVEYFERKKERWKKKHSISQ